MSVLEDKAMYQSFLDETGMHIESIKDQITKLDGRNNEVIFNQIHRRFHTMRGSSAYLNFIKMEELAYLADSILNSIKASKTDHHLLVKEHFPALLEKLDEIHAHIELVGSEEGLNIIAVSNKFKQILEDLNKTLDNEKRSPDTNISYIGKPLSILLVDEIESELGGLGLTLEQFNYKLVAVNSLEQLQQSLIQGPVDIIIVGYQKSETDSQDVLDFMQKKGILISHPCIKLISSSQYETAYNFYEQGFKALLDLDLPEELNLAMIRNLSTGHNSDNLNQVNPNKAMEFIVQLSELNHDNNNALTILHNRVIKLKRGMKNKENKYITSLEEQCARLIKNTHSIRDCKEKYKQFISPPEEKKKVC